MKKLIAAMLVVIPLLGACGDDDATEDAMTAVCDAEVQVLEDLAALSSLDPTQITGDDFKAMVESLQSSVDQLEEARGDLAEQDVDNVSSAYDSLKTSVEDLGDDVPLAELEDAVVGEIGTAIQGLDAAYAEAYANSSCTPDAEG